MRQKINFELNIYNKYLLTTQINFSFTPSSCRKVKCSEYCFHNYIRTNKLNKINSNKKGFFVPLEVIIIINHDVLTRMCELVMILNK